MSKVQVTGNIITGGDSGTTQLYMRYVENFVVANNYLGEVTTGENMYLYYSEYGTVTGNNFAEDSHDIETATEHIRWLGNVGGFVQDYAGTETLSGDGAETEFDIDWDSYMGRTPASWTVMLASDVGGAMIEYSELVTDPPFPPQFWIRCYFDSAPDNGTDNVIIVWSASSYDVS